MRVQNEPIRGALAQLAKSDVAKVRNRVFHKEGYRPTKEQARALFDEARDILWTLAEELDVRYESV